jgi:site-specific DNA recombinase
MIAIYVRVSTEEQLKGYSVEGQIDDCIELAGTNEILQYVDDGYTGEILNRPALTKLLTDVEDGLIEKVICYDPDRLSRKLLNQLLITEKLEKNDVVLEFVQSDYKNDAEGQLYFQVRGAFSEFDKAKIKHNTMTGRYRKAQQGFVVKNSGLYGYNYDKEKKTYVIHPDEAKVVQMIFNYFTNPDTSLKGINGIAHHLTELGIPTAKGGKVWHRQVVRQMLLNESYTGTYYQNKYDTEGDYVKKQAGEDFKRGRIRPREEWIEAEIPRIIDEQQFEYAQVLLKQVRRRYAGFNRHSYLLSGLVRCGRCGNTMNGRKTRSHGKDFYIYECRKNYAGAKDRGCGRTMSENKLNNHVWSIVVELLDNPNKISEYEDNPQKTYIHDELQHLETQIEKTRNGRKRLLTLISMSEDDIDIEEVKEKMRELQRTEKELQVKLAELQTEVSTDEKDSHSALILEEVIEYYLTVKGTNFSIEEKQKILKMIIEEVEVVNPDMINVHTF